MKLSLLISSFNRLKLFRRTLWSIAHRPPAVDFEVVVADECSTDDILGELRRYSFPWKFIRVNMSEFEKWTHVRKFWNCPALTNNVAFRYASGELVAQLGNEIILWDNALDQLLADMPQAYYGWAVSQTFDVPEAVLAQLDEYGTNFSASMLKACERWLLSNDNNVPNYLSVFTRGTWEAVGGYDERYIGGISAEDSDFMRRVMRLQGFQLARSSAISLHQNHGGVSHFQRPKPEVITEARLEEGVAINRQLFRSWDGRISNGQTWPAGTIGVMEVIES